MTVFTRSQCCHYNLFVLYQIFIKWYQLNFSSTLILASYLFDAFFFRQHLLVFKTNTWASWFMQEAESLSVLLESDVTSMSGLAKWANQVVKSPRLTIKCTGCQRRSRSSPLLLTVTSCHIKIGGEVSAWANSTVPTNIFATKVKLRICLFNDTRFQRTNCCLHNNLFVLQRKIILRKGSS